MIKLYRTASVISLSLCCILFAACTSAFPNDELDEMWRLDKIEFPNGFDFEGNECDMKAIDNVWYCFAREIVQIHRNHTDYIGKAHISDNSLFFDFSGYNRGTGYNPEQVLKEINALGVEAICTEYHIDELNGSTMILTGRNTRLYFTRW